MLKKLAILFICVTLAVALCACNKTELTAEDGASAPEAERTGYRETTLYYPTDDGFMVPVMKLIPWEEGIGRAALGCLVDNADNRSGAARMGLKTVIPDGTRIALRIYDDGNANVDLSGMGELADAAAEHNLITAVVNTLSEFEAISSVSFTVDGQACDALPHGTAVDGRFSRQALNIEQSELAVSTQDMHALTLYYPNGMASLNVPVTRYTEREPDLFTRMSEFLQGPENAALLNCCPLAAQLVSAETVNGTAVVHIESAAPAGDMGEDMLTALYTNMLLSACEAPDVHALWLYINGEQVLSGAQTPAHPNEFLG